MTKQEHPELKDTDHRELLLFAQGTLQDIRDSKAEQRRTVVSALVLLGALLALKEKIEQPSLCLRVVMASIAALIVLGAVGYVSRWQKTILLFRARMSVIYNSYFSLDLTPILGSLPAYSDPRQFKIWGDLVPLWLAVLFGSGAVTIGWLFLS